MTAVLYSQSQRAVHVEVLGEFITKEARDCRKQKKSRYRLVFVGPDAEAREVADAWQNRRNQGES